MTSALDTSSGLRLAILDGVARAEALVTGTGLDAASAGTEDRGPMSAWTDVIAAALLRSAPGPGPDSLFPDASRLGPLGVAPEILGLAVAAWAPTPGVASHAVRGLGPAVGATPAQVQAATAISTLAVILSEHHDEQRRTDWFLRAVDEHVPDELAGDAMRRLRLARRTGSELSEQLRVVMSVPEPLHPLLVAVTVCAHHEFDLPRCIMSIRHLGQRPAVIVGGLVAAAGQPGS